MIIYLQCMLYIYIYMHFLRLYYAYKMGEERYTNVGTVPKFNRKIVERQNRYPQQMHMTAYFSDLVQAFQ